jgi:hypothetical protein
VGANQRLPTSAIQIVGLRLNGHTKHRRIRAQVAKGVTGGPNMPLTSLVRLTTSPNKLANVCNWHECDMAGWRMDVRFRSKSGHAADISAMTESARSMTRYPPMGGQLHRTHHLVETEQRVGSAVLDSSAPQQSARGPERCSADEYLQKLPAGKPQTALPIIRLQYLPCNLAEEGEGPLVARCVVSLQRHSSDAIGGEADIARTSRTCRFEVNDPLRTWAGRFCCDARALTCYT